MTEKPTTYIVLDEDGKPDVREGTLSLDEAQELVGGDVEELPRVTDLTCLAIETPRSTDRFNWAATRLYQNRLPIGDRVFGTVLLFGEADEEGDLTSVPQQTILTLQEWYEHRQ